MADDTNEVLLRVLHRLDDVQSVLEQRIARVENKLDSFRAETLANFDEIYRRLDRLESEYQSISAAVARLEQRAENDAADRKQIRQEIERLKARVADLEEKLNQLETDTRDSHDA